MDIALVNKQYIRNRALVLLRKWTSCVIRSNILVLFRTKTLFLSSKKKDQQQHILLSLGKLGIPQSGENFAPRLGEPSGQDT